MRDVNSTAEGSPDAQRSREDIQEFNIESILPEKVRDVVKKTKAYTVECVTINSHPKKR